MLHWHSIVYLISSQVHIHNVFLPGVVSQLFVYTVPPNSNKLLHLFLDTKLSSIYKTERELTRSIKISDSE